MLILEATTLKDFQAIKKLLKKLLKEISSTK